MKYLQTYEGLISNLKQYFDKSIIITEEEKLITKSLEDKRGSALVDVRSFHNIELRSEAISSIQIVFSNEKNRRKFYDIKIKRRI
jgi:hypothetical protein